MDGKVWSLYTNDMTTHGIVDAFQEMYRADVSPMLLSKITDTVIKQVTEW